MEHRRGRARVRRRSQKRVGEGGALHAARDSLSTLRCTRCTTRYDPGVTTPPMEGGGAGKEERGGAGAGIRSIGEEEECACSYTLPTRSKEGGDAKPAPVPALAPAHADTTDHGDAQADKDEDSASLLAAALAEIDLLDAASNSSSDGVSSNDDDDHLDFEADSLVLEADASPSSLVLDSSSDASPSRSLAHDSSPTSPSHSPATELDQQAADTDPSAPSLDGDEDKEQTTPYPHIFAIGDAADAFGALPAGHNAWAQGEVVEWNVLRLISRYGGDGITGEGCEGKNREEDEELELETYTPGLPAIKVSLGLHKTIYQVNGAVGVTVGKEREDLNAGAMWGVFGIDYERGAEDGRGTDSTARGPSCSSESGAGVVARSRDADKSSCGIAIPEPRDGLHGFSIDEDR
ncbi:hypothetical protein B0H13DRAFT_2512801 [Mycena leptocephala]|nr:hypothetical protein B0H13DRAFT_2512801 [Mycena leptocephala]